MSKVILILHRDFSKGTGGAASIKDLSFFLENQGYAVYHSQLVFNFDSIKFLFKKNNYTLNVGGLLNFPNNNFNFKNLLRKILSIIFKIINYREFIKFYKVLNNAKVIIHTLPINEYLINKIKLNSLKSKHVYNHAGSVETFEKYWLKHIKFQKEKQKQNSKYLYFFNKFDFILFQSIDQKNYCDSKYPKLSKKTIFLAPTCNEKEIIDSKHYKSPFAKNKNIIVNVGTICRRKNQKLSIEAFVELNKMMKDCEMHFIGKIENNYFQELESLIYSNNLEKKIFFHGYKNDYLKYMNHANLITLTSRSEGVSRILRESIFLKVPVVATKISGTSEILKNGCGIMISDFDKDALSQAYFKILNERKFTLKMVNLAYNRYNQTYSNKSYSNKINKIFKKIYNEI